jgi:hypothetical protein
VEEIKLVPITGKMEEVADNKYIPKRPSMKNEKYEKGVQVPNATKE